MLANEQLVELKDFLAKLAATQTHFYAPAMDTYGAIDELLALRSLRDAGDDNQLIVQLAGCLCAAEGSSGSPVAKQGDYGWSLAYQKTLELHQQLREAREEIERLDQVVRELKDNFGEMEVGA